MSYVQDLAYSTPTKFVSFLAVTDFHAAEPGPKGASLQQAQLS